MGGVTDRDQIPGLCAPGCQGAAPGWLRACLLAGGHQSFGGGVARALPCRRATRPAAGGCGGADPAAHAAGSAMGRPSSLCLTGRQLGVERALLEACLDAVAAPVPILGFHCTFLGGRFGRVCGLLAMASVRDRKPERFHRRRNKVPLWIWSALVARQRLTRAAFIHLSAHCVPPAMLALCRRRWRALDPPRWRL